MKESVHLERSEVGANQEINHMVILDLRNPVLQKTHNASPGKDEGLRLWR